MQGLKDLQEASWPQRLVGIKRMGELDNKPFQISCKRKFSKDEADFRAAELCSMWQDELKNPEWHPFKIVNVDGKDQVCERDFLVLCLLLFRKYELAMILWDK